MTTVKNCLEHKPQPTALVSVTANDTIVTVLQLMRDKRVMGLMALRNFRHLPVVEAGHVVGVVSVGDVVKDNIRQMGQQIGFLETYIKGHGA